MHIQDCKDLIHCQSMGASWRCPAFEFMGLLNSCIQECGMHLLPWHAHGWPWRATR